MKYFVFLFVSFVLSSAMAAGSAPQCIQDYLGIDLTKYADVKPMVLSAKARRAQAVLFGEEKRAEIEAASEAATKCIYKHEERAEKHGMKLGVLWIEELGKSSKNIPYIQRYVRYRTQLEKGEKTDIFSIQVTGAIGEELKKKIDCLYCRVFINKSEDDRIRNYNNLCRNNNFPECKKERDDLVKMLAAYHSAQGIIVKREGEYFRSKIEEYENKVCQNELAERNKLYKEEDDANRDWIAELKALPPEARRWMVSADGSKHPDDRIFELGLDEKIYTVHFTESGLSDLKRKINQEDEKAEKEHAENRELYDSANKNYNEIALHEKYADQTAFSKGLRARLNSEKIEIENEMKKRGIDLPIFAGIKSSRRYHLRGLISGLPESRSTSFKVSGDEIFIPASGIHPCVERSQNSNPSSDTQK